MSVKGLQLCCVGFCRYDFEEGPPGEYAYRLEMLENLPSHTKSVQYIRFLEATVAEHIGSLFRWVYFRKKTDRNGSGFFSDTDSRVRHLNRMLALIGTLCGANLLNSSTQFSAWLSSSGGMGNLMAAILCLLVGGLLGYGLLRVILKKRGLKKERILHG